jgi:hypothetical protein
MKGSEKPEQCRTVEIEMVYDTGSQGADFNHWTFPPRLQGERLTQMGFVINGGLYIRKGFPVPKKIILTPVIWEKEGEKG